MNDTTSRPHITVVGDLILDRYLIGDATKLNPEQPGVVIRVDREEVRLGGAATVAMIAAGLGASVTLAGVIGRDEPGDQLRRLIDAQGINRTCGLMIVQQRGNNVSWLVGSCVRTAVIAR